MSKSKIILCVDDCPERYEYLARLCAPQGITVVVTDRIPHVRFYTESLAYTIIGVCLDHDMPGSPNGVYFAEHYFKDHNWPVAITSNNSVGAHNIANMLDEGETRYAMMPASFGQEYAERLLKYFTYHSRAALGS